MGNGNSSLRCLTSNEISKQEMAETAIDDCEFNAARIGLVSPESPISIQFTQMWVSRMIT